MAGVTITPDLIVSLATLITAITALVRALMTHQVAQDTNTKVSEIEKNTNGVLAGVQQQVKDLRSTQATPAELADRTAPPPP